MPRSVLFLSLFWVLGGARAEPLPPIAERFLAAFHAIHQGAASPADVDRLLGLCTEDVVYEHSRVGAVVRGKADLRAGFLAHLGETRSDTLRVLHVAQGQRFVALEVARTFDVKEEAGWRAVSRKQLLVLERDEHDRIRRVLDDW